MRHFGSDDIQHKGSRKELRVGAIPRLYMPAKSVITESQPARQPPTIRLQEEKVYQKSLEELEKNSLRYLPESWDFVKKKDHIAFHTTYCMGGFPKYMIKINNALKVQAGFYGWFTNTSKIDVKKITITNILHTISHFPICQGIAHDQDFKFKDKDAVVMHYRMNFDDRETMTTIPQPPSIDLVAIRSRDCSVFLDSGGTCQSCEAAEKKLKQSFLARQSYKRQVGATPLSKRSSLCLNDRLLATVKHQDLKLEELELMVKDRMKSSSSHVSVDEDLSSDMNTLFSAGLERNEVTPFFRLFWNEQIKLNKASKYGRRFHPELIRFCLELALKSSSAYEQLRDTGILVLPSMRTLFEYRSFHNSSPGFSNSIREDLTRKAESMQSHERMIVLSMDEIKVKENIVYSVAKDQMVGFTDLGETRTPDGAGPATHALQVYARGLVTSFSRPIAYYATKSIASFQLTSIFWECVGEMEKCGFRVVAFIADGLSANRKMYQELNNMKLEYAYKCRNIFNTLHDIYLIFDPPHLLKTVRNNLFASRTDGTRSLFKDGRDIKWEHFTAVPKLFETTELRCCKLNDAHFRMLSYSKMRVVYAAQLLSNTVAHLMRSRGGRQMESSAWFADTFNKWFDIMNSSKKYTYNNNLKPYYSGEDDRLKWLESYFLPELKRWKESCDAYTNATVDERSKMFLCWQTYHGLVTTSMAITELIRTILPTLPEGSYILTRRLNQDPLEAFFGQIRRSGGTYENPDICHYGYFQRIVGVGKDLKWRRGSNVQPDTSDPVLKRIKKS